MASGSPGERLREFFDSTAGKLTAAVICVVALLILYVSARPRNDAADLSSRRTFICSETNKPFTAKLETGMTIPIKSPFSGKNTGYPAELCYWTKDGGVRKEPFPVLLKRTLDPTAGPTFCPDCGRLVVGHNPDGAGIQRAPQATRRGAATALASRAGQPP
jgi:hypothetical protein